MTSVDDNTAVQVELSERRRGKRRVEPFSLIAERAVVGSMLVYGSARKTAFDRPLLAVNFVNPECRAVFCAMEKLKASGGSFDVKCVAEQMRRDETLKLVKERGLLEMTADSVYDVTSHVEVVAELAGFRRAIAVGGDLIDAAYAVDYDEIVKVVHTAADRIIGGVLDRVDVSPALDVLSFRERDQVQRNFIVPRLLVAGDRMIVTGAEGGGKSTYLRQQAVQFAAGIHPMTLNPMRALRVVFFDLQDSGEQIETEFSTLLGVEDTRAKIDRGMLRVVRRRQGFDLLNPADARWFEEQVGDAEVVILGPIYKSYRARERVGKHDPALVEEVTATYDEIIERTQAAMLFEAHSPHGVDGNRANLRPDGPARWLAWPEFGHGLKPMKPRDGETEPRGVWLTRFRGDRDKDREWPRSLFFGGRGRWPFLAPLDQVM